MMTISNKIREQMLALCGSICDDDGQAAKDFHARKTKRHKSDEYKHQRLCQQVARTLALVVTESAIESIRDLKIDSVVPGKNTSVLTVRIVALDAVTQEEQFRILDLLKQQEGWLRSEVASSITRKKVPRLAFEIAVADNNFSGGVR